MNLLAHFFLSGNSQKQMVGSFIADEVKGSAYLHYEEEVAQGIMLHRKIDTFTDSHPMVTKSKDLLRKQYGKLSGIIVDIFYDHCLAVNWKEYSEEPLQRYANKVYATLFSHYLLLPGKSKRILPYMAKGNWLVRYGTVEGIERSLADMDRRTSFPSDMAGSVRILHRDYKLFEKDFRSFMPEVIRHAKEESGKKE